MKKFFIILILINFALKIAICQPFNYSINKDGFQETNSKLILPNGNVLFGTFTNDTGSNIAGIRTEFYLLNSKTNAVSPKIIPNITDKYVIIGSNLLSDNKILLCGFERIKNQTFLYQAAVMVMCDINFNILWEKSYPVLPVEPNVISIGTSTVKSKTGELYLFGTQRKAENIPQQNDPRLILVVKTDSIGNLLNQVTHDLNNYNISINVNYHLNENTFTIVSQAIPSENSIFTMNDDLSISDSSKMQIQNFAFYGQDSYLPSFLKSTNKNNKITTLVTSYFTAHHIDSNTAALRKYTQLGYYEIDNNLDSVYFDTLNLNNDKLLPYPYGITYDGDSIMYIAAIDSNGNNEYVYDNDQYIAKINTKTKKTIWEKYIKTPDIYHYGTTANSLFLDNYGSLVIFGRAINRKSDKDYDMFFMKIDTLGNLTSNIKTTPLVYFWNVFPIPSTTEININLELTNNTLPHIIKITDMLGKEVFTQKYISETNQIKLNTSNYKSGNYIIQWYTGNMLLSAKKITIN